jgi:hypothetical protein
MKPLFLLKKKEHYQTQYRPKRKIPIKKGHPYIKTQGTPEKNNNSVHERT